jgi:hypothetical protein
MGACHCKASTAPDSSNISNRHPGVHTQSIASILLDEFGFLLKNNQTKLGQLTVEGQQNHDVSKTWQQVIRSAEPVKEFQSHISSANTFLCKGIPSEIRHEVWIQLSGASTLKIQSSKSYQDYVIGVDSLTVAQVQVDAPRTFSTHPYFRENSLGRHRLIRLLHAIASRLEPAIGYVQGMNMVAAVILFVVDDEEDAFWVLVAFMESLNMKAMYADGLRSLTENLNRLGQSISLLMPQLRSHFGQENIEPFCYATPWFLTMFAYNLPVRQVVRLYDVAFCLQKGHAFVHRFALVFIESVMEELLKSTFTGSTTILKNIVLEEKQLESLLQKSLDLDLEGPNEGRSEEEGGEIGAKEKSTNPTKDADSQDLNTIPGAVQTMNPEAVKTSGTIYFPS